MATSRIDIDRILCPVDFSEFSAPALERAVRLGQWFEARVEVLHVLPFLPFAMPPGMGPAVYLDPLEVTPAQREEAAKDMGALVEPFLEEGVPIVTKVLEGEPWRVILAEAKSVPADLLVLGTHGRSGFERLLLGSVTERVLRRAPCPVLTVGHVRTHPRKGPLFRRILCAADLTQASPQTLDVALSLATENDAQITLLHVIETLPPGHAALGPSGRIVSGSIFMSPETSPLRNELVAQAREELRKAVPGPVRIFCEVTERVETGAPWREILRVAEEMEADLIVMGAHATGAVGRMLFGSTASHVVRQAQCPVFVIQESHKPRPAAESAEAVGVAVDRRRG